jgi:hypothetical protein
MISITAGFPMTLNGFLPMPERERASNGLSVPRLLITNTLWTISHTFFISAGVIVLIENKDLASYRLSHH